ncbi:NADH dehydrogenase subunit J [Ignatzschineria indica]|uniref:NADH-quinone oxidoreductase subunit J n=1 Tax=Ignatzschineria indica TaxID=472583 RepID=A0A2U2AIW4_9GAMM|nr:NADH-quinone oxidoreductase subunit J [Ignatzschineria indica]PWD82593.1 NADH-quinone oxidoreductase subunit J [Ignatzschineria indica]GGZ85170.1 NADH dehydrogenase subunit J [Ignatzschineria indica]
MLFKILFYIFALITIYSAIRVVSAKNTMTSVLHLVLIFVMVSCCWLLLQAEFLALSLIIIYCGAVMVFFLFAVMMLDIPHDLLKEGFVRYLPIAVLVAIIFIAEILIVILGGDSFIANQFALEGGVESIRAGTELTNAQELGVLLYTNYIYAFEATALILLVAMIAAIALTRRIGPLRRKDVSVSWAIKADPTKRVRMVKMDSAVLAPAPVKEESEDAVTEEEEK